ncbi:hypothetical protein PPROV_000000800 [Pycnococcus provasolii]|uniref:Urease accessory protein UreH-like transmembrane domain-containing protein n=1 Tax=Pycnococcus provasolii TaxID=41880 RepID=A0A830H410_9CHLO|nr:hypothetical protein PPROV_000000800 [Pycnococcus provasolii]
MNTVAGARSRLSGAAVVSSRARPPSPGVAAQASAATAQTQLSPPAAAAALPTLAQHTPHRRHSHLSCLPPVRRRDALRVRCQAQNPTPRNSSSNSNSNVSGVQKQSSKSAKKTNAVDAGIIGPSWWGESTLPVMIRRARLGVFAAAAIGALVLLIRCAPELANLADLQSGGGITAVTRVCWAGLAAGFLHTLAGPDHLAALAPLTFGRSTVAAASLGCLWGFGHSAGQGILAILFVVFREKLTGTFPLLAQSAGVLIGISLIIIGLHGLHEARELEEQLGVTADTASVVSVASSAGEQKDEKFGFATFMTGVVYGLQPDALLVILPALALSSASASISFILAFVIGTVVAMGSYTAGISQACSALGQRVPLVTGKLATLAAGLAIMLGCALGGSSLFTLIWR